MMSTYIKRKQSWEIDLEDCESKILKYKQKLEKWESLKNVVLTNINKWNKIIENEKKNE